MTRTLQLSHSIGLYDVQNLVLVMKPIHKLPHFLSKPLEGELGWDIDMIIRFEYNIMALMDSRNAYITNGCVHLRPRPAHQHRK
jgi:hypothetical protein